jgi:ABC-type multidrug transport system fused ATPase/permease subunit
MPDSNLRKNSTVSLLLGIWRQLMPRRRIQLLLVMLVMLASSVAELVSLGAILPFLAVLSDPGQLWQEPFVQHLSVSWGFTQASQLLVPAAAVFALAAVLAALIRLLNLWLTGRLAAAVGSDLSCEAYRRTLYQPYEVHLQRNSSTVITATTTQISGMVVSLNALLQLLTGALVAVGLLTGLLLIDLPAALVASLVFGSVYGLLAMTARRALNRNGRRIVETSRQQLKALQEGLGAIRDVLLDGSQPTYTAIYRQADLLQRQLQARNQFLAAFPRYLLEALGLVVIALLGCLLVLQRGGAAPVIPLLGALALGAQRLLPAFQMMYTSWAVLKGNKAAIASVLEMLHQPLPAIISSQSPLAFCHILRLDSVQFCYRQELPAVLSQLNLAIHPGERIGLIGSTGSGKSTTVDLIMGLLIPTSGWVLVDGQNIHDPSHPERLLNWRASIAHVPQTIYLADNTIAENIAFGVPSHLIDMERVRHAAAQAQIADFIEDNPRGYQAYVGERGIRLSGGQRQRIGIARALYKQARVLVFDEATSALDHETEEAVMNAIEGLTRDLTVILIAHRLTTVERCDRVIRLSQGAIVADGPPQQVLANSHHSESPP